MVMILDNTLREGEQTPGVYFDPHIKLAIAQLLDRIGVDIIEAGHPLVSEEIHDAVKTLAAQGFRAKVGAHSRSVQKDVDLALECGVNFLGIFYCVSDERLSTVFKKDLDVAVAKICEVIRYAKEQNPNLLVRYTPEDTVRSNFENVVTAAVAACRAGADIISIADTTGHMVPGTDRSMYNYVKNLRAAFEEAGVKPKIAVHLHNDRGLALANAIDAYRAGADIIDASVLGLGERAGVVDLATLLAVLHEDFGEGQHWNLELLPELYELVSKHSGVPIPINQPVTGKNAFTHCAGVHIQAAIIDPLHYQSLDPALVGRVSENALDHMSGVASVKFALERIGVDASNPEFVGTVLRKVKMVGQKGKLVGLDELKHIVESCKTVLEPITKEVK